MTSHFDRGLIPPPEPFYRHELPGLSRPNSTGWASAQCCFHQSDPRKRKRSKPLRVNVRQGHFVCMSCGVKGSDPIAFVMARDRVDFKRACQSLGCWKDGGLSPADRARIEHDRLNREKEWLRIEALEAERRQERIDVRGTLHLVEKLEREASRDLTRLRDCPDGSSEKESAWELLAAFCGPIRELDFQYRQLTGIEVRP